MLVVEVDGIVGVVGMVVMGAGLTVVSVDVVRVIMGEPHAATASVKAAAKPTNAVREAMEDMFIDILLRFGGHVRNPQDPELTGHARMGLGSVKRFSV